MGRWIVRREGHVVPMLYDKETNLAVGHSEVAEFIHAAHEESCAAYEERISALECRLARIAELVKPVPVADLVEAGTEAPKLLAERQAAIRAILEEEG